MAKKTQKTKIFISLNAEKLTEYQINFAFVFWHVCRWEF